MWNLPLQTHRYFIEALGGMHLETMLYLQFTKFIQSINIGIKEAPIYLLNIIKDDTNTITGRNIREILNSTNENNIFNLKLSKIREHKFCEVPENEKWRINFIKELTNVKLKNLEINFTKNEELTRKEIDAIIEIISTM